MCIVVHSVPLIFFPRKRLQLFSNSHILDDQNVSMLCSLHGPTSFVIGERYTNIMKHIWEKGPIGNWSHHVGFILE